MLNFAKPLPKDHAEVAKRIKSKLFDEERKKRIFNPRSRIIGIDKDALDRQIYEKKLLEDQEKSREEAYCKKLLQDCEVSLKLEEQNRKKQKQIDLEILEFRKKYQTPETRREHDLNDPHHSKKGQTSEINENDLRSTVSSGQYFEGEDGTSKEFRAEQIKQQRVWLEMQIREKRMAEEENKNVEKTWQEIQEINTQRAKALANLENECRKKLVEATSRYNQALAAEKEMSRRITETENNEDKMAEVYNAITGDFLTENPELGFNSALGPGKICKSLYKGLTPAMKQAIFDEQEKQRQELKLKKEAFEKREKDWAELLNMLARCGTLSDREMQRKRQSLEKEITEFNLKLADEKKKEQQFLNEQLYKGKASDEFYDQFNKTTR
ncbi:RIB43A-like with coiled-coils protein 2 [Daktulosphaira vitifoliae]|uniref:RIB43A-like with coiled-coils protein 2 n=1 Tax=Daktulosphaira vitifoliae TaxID=58002 RepID=UPI0021A97E78|nr:RIB43A-like with coiled-coils protein 2 [Daktulosphaira vitifoliae]